MSAISWLDRLSGAVLRYLGGDMPQRGSIEFVGSGVVVTDDETNDKSIVTIAGGGGGGAAGAAGAVQMSDGAGGLTATGNATLPTSLAVGATPATTGTIRLPNGAVITARNAADAGDIQVVSSDNSNYVYLGNQAGGYIATSDANDLIIAQPAHGIVLRIIGGEITTSLPILGNGSSSPNGVHGGVAFVAAAANTVTADQYALDWIELSAGGFIVAPFTVDFPLPATKRAGYYKTIVNNTAQTATITAGAGAGTTRDLATGLAQRFWFDDTGVRYAGPTFTP